MRSPSGHRNARHNRRRTRSQKHRVVPALVVDNRESADLARGLEPFDGLIETTHVQPCAPDVLSATAVDLREVLGRVCCLVVVGEVRSRAKRVEGSRRFDRGVSLKKCDELLTNEARHRANDAGTGRLLPSRR
jgi:hypothetical protein